MQDESMDGMPSEQRFRAKFTRTFIRATKKIDQTLLKDRLKEILEDPYSARDSHTLSYEWSGFRASTFSGKDRIVYRVCEECDQKNQREIHSMLCCGDPNCELRTITFVHFGDYHKMAGHRRILPTRFELTDPT